MITYATTPKVSEEQLRTAIGELGEYVAIKSYSAVANKETYCSETLKKAAEFAGEKLRGLDFSVSYEVVSGIQEKNVDDPLHYDSPPYVLAQKIVNASLPTFILYAHYDIQPVELSKWETDPFLMTEKNGRLYGRGASDDKAGVISILTVLKMYRESGIELPVNITVLLEGEEESGSKHMSEFLKTHASKLNAVALIVLDGINADVTCGCLTTLTRGLVSMNIKAHALEKPVHSGIGLLAPDSSMGLVCVLSSLANPSQILGFKDGFIPLQAQQIGRYNRLSISAEKYAKEQGVRHGIPLQGDPNMSVYQRIAEKESLTISKIHAGQPDGGNVIPEQAEATINARILPGQDPIAVALALENHIKKQDVSGVKISVRQTGGTHAWSSDSTAPYASKYMDAMKEHFPTIGELPCGGTLPLLHEFKQYLPNKMEMIVPGVEDPDTAAHSHNESQSIAVLERSINALASFLWNAATH